MVWPEARPAVVRRGRPFPFPVDLPVAGIWALAAAALTALVIFDLSPPLAFNDDWMYRWSVEQLLAGHGLRAFRPDTPLALVQVVWGALFSLGHADARLLRLSIVPVVALSAWCCYQLARRLHADRFWCAVAAATLLGMPLFMANATTFMSDNFFVGLAMTVALTSVVWIFDGKWRWLCVALLVISPLQRQVGIAMVPAVTLGLLLWRRPAWTRADTAALVSAWTLSLGAMLLAGRLAISQPAPSAGLPSVVNAGHALFPLAPMLGLGLIPYAAALALRPRARDHESGWSLAWAALGIFGAFGCLVDLSQFGMIFPGNVFSPLGFTAILPGSKPPIFPGLVFQAIEIAAATTFVLLFVFRRRTWTPGAVPREALQLSLISIALFLPLLIVPWFIYDRYFLPVVAPLVPVVAAVATGALRQRAAKGWAAIALAAGLMLYVIGDQDYLAWQAARDRAALLAYQSVQRNQVQAGFEANAVYVELPDYDRSGVANRFAITGPAQPRVTLRFAGPADPRPGVSYWSLAPGRIVLDR
jgi:hypothetical protein